MKLFKYYVMVLQWSSAFAGWYRPDNDDHQVRLAVHSYDTDFASFTPSEILEPKTRKSELYELALIDLKKLSKESTCHQTAAKVYMSSCQLFKELGVHSDENVATHGRGHLQDYIDSFAISRAICDLETAHAATPGECKLFREPALLGVINSKGVQGLQISHGQIGQCMKGLHSDQKSWTSYNSNKDSAALLCRASRIDIERDDFISTAQGVINILREVILTDDQRKADQAEADLAVKTYFQNVREQVSNLKDQFLRMWNQVSEESIGVANGLIDALRNASDDVEATRSAMGTILTSLTKGNAEHALAQKEAVQAASSLTSVVQNATTAVLDFRRLMGEAGYNVTAMGVALIAVEQHHAEAIHEQDMQVLELLKNVRKELQDIQEITFEVMANAERTAQWFLNWNLGINPAGPWGISWVLLLVAPAMTVVLVGYGIQASYTRNIGLVVIGILVAKVLTVTINGQWDNYTITPSVYTQLAPDNFKADDSAITFCS